MDLKIFKLIIVFLIYIIIYEAMNFKIKNFISEVYSTILNFVMYFALIAVILLGNGIDEAYYLLIVFIILYAIIIAYKIWRKKKIYCFKDIDRKLIEEKKSDILDIVYGYNREIEVSIENNRIIFDKDDKNKIEECLELVGNYLNENRKKYTVKDYAIYYTKTIIFPVAIVAVIFTIFHIINNFDSFAANVEQISIKNELAEGNTEGNINNYGLVTETDEYIYYVNEFKIYKSDRDLKNKTPLVEQPENLGKDTLNVVEGWIFYRQGNEIKRARTDGTNVETIFKGYSLHMKVVGNWIYFVSLKDDGKICRIDVNGENKSFLCNESVYDIAVYDGKIYYSYEGRDGAHLEVINTDSTGLQSLADIKTRSMIADGDYIYYIDDIDEILCRMNLKDKTVEKLSRKQVLKFIKDGGQIFYTLKDDTNNSVSRYKGLYSMNVDGSNLLDIDSECYLSETAIGVTESFVFYNSINSNGQPDLKIINKNDFLSDRITEKRGYRVLFDGYLSSTEKYLTRKQVFPKMAIKPYVIQAGPYIAMDLLSTVQIH